MNKFSLSYNWEILEPKIYLLYISGISIGADYSDPFGSSGFENIGDYIKVNWKLLK